MARKKKLGVERKDKPERNIVWHARGRFFLKYGGREGIRTPGLLIANGESLKLRRVATIS
jgi:hypothetical protein